MSISPGASVLITNFTFQGYTSITTIGSAINLLGASSSDIINCNISNNSNGIIITDGVTGSASNKIEGTTIANNIIGISLDLNTSATYINSNVISGNSDTGLLLTDFATKNSINSNDISNNGIGLHLTSNTTKNVYLNNRVFNNSIGIEDNNSSSNYNVVPTNIVFP